MAKLGVHVYEKATSVQTPKVATVGIPFVVGTAPVQSAAKPAKSNTPVLATSWDEAVKKLGFSYDWENYTLCEFMYSHFQLFGAQPVIFCNILDPESMKKDAAADYDVADHKISLSMKALQSAADNYSDYDDVADVDIDALDLGQIHELTVEAQVLVGRNRADSTCAQQHGVAHVVAHEGEVEA